MAPAATDIVETKETVPLKRHAVAAAIGLAAIIWLSLLSGWLEVRPGSVVSQRQNVIFSSDTTLWIAHIFGHLRPDLGSIHPLQIVFWRGPCRAAAAIARIFLPLDAAAYAVPAEYVGARVLVALVVGIGIAWLAFLALRIGVRTAECLVLFLMYFLFTSNATICLPEHFGISNGLLTVAFAAPLLATSSRARLFILGALTPLIGGTTITNAIFPVLSLMQSGFKSARVRAVAIILGIPTALGVAYTLYHVSWNYFYFINTYMALRVWHNPLSTGTYMFYFLVAPAIGPPPLVAGRPLGLMLTYEPLTLALYAGISAIGPALGLCCCGNASEGYRHPRHGPRSCCF